MIGIALVADPVVLIGDANALSSTSALNVESFPSSGEALAADADGAKTAADAFQPAVGDLGLTIGVPGEASDGLMLLRESTLGAWTTSSASHASLDKLLSLGISGRVGVLPCSGLSGSLFDKSKGCSGDLDEVLDTDEAANVEAGGLRPATDGDTQSATAPVQEGIGGCGSVFCAAVLDFSAVDAFVRSETLQVLVGRGGRGGKGDRSFRCPSRCSVALAERTALSMAFAP